jgi:hypothetical protein
MQQLAALVLQQLQLYHSMQSAQQHQHQPPGTCLAGTSGPLLQTQQLQQQRGEVPAGSSAGCAGPQQPARSHCSSSSGDLLQAHCQTLKLQLQQLSETADALVQQASIQESNCLNRHAGQAVAAAVCGVGQLPLDLQDPLDSDPNSLSGQSVAVSEAIQQLRQGMQGFGAAHSSSNQQQQGSIDVRLHHAMQHQHGCHASSSQQDQQLQVVKLRLAYQQMLHKVQARYQQDLRQLEVKHQEVRTGSWRSCKAECLHWWRGASTLPEQACNGSGCSLFSFCWQANPSA